MNNNKNSLTIDMNFPLMLFIVFLVLKLTNTIDWDWIWVFAPLWIPLALFVLILSVMIFITFVQWIVEEYHYNKNKESFAFGTRLIWNPESKEFINGPKYPKNEEENNEDIQD